jgi:hypothetical protein
LEKVVITIQLLTIAKHITVWKGLIAATRQLIHVDFVPRAALNDSDCAVI